MENVIERSCPLFSPSASPGCTEQLPIPSVTPNLWYQFHSHRLSPAFVKIYSSSATLSNQTSELRALFDLT